MRRSALDLRYVRVAVTARVDGAAVDPTVDVVKLAFPATGVQPAAGDWKTADWETDAGTYYARCLVGPAGTVTLTAGRYDVWVKVTDSPEVPVLMAGHLTVF